MKKYQNFSEFYLFYLEEHKNKMCRRLHFFGTFISLSLITYSLISMQWWLLPLAIIVGYAFAWSGHYFFEKNRPATFDYPFYSFLGDFVMFKDILLGRVSI